MGDIVSRRNSGNEVVEIRTNNAYRYPPKSGSYFGSHFIMGGERFDMTQPEAYLFGSNQDLNFLGNRPIPFPYPTPQGNEPTKTLKSLVNIRKDSLKFVKVVEPHKVGEEKTEKKKEKKEKKEGEEGKEDGDKEEEEEEEEEEVTNKYNVEFTFDSDAKCAITIYYFASEEIAGGQIIYHPRDCTMNSETFHYKRGANQTFNQSTHIVEPHKFPEEDWQYGVEKESIPVVIQCVVEEEEYMGHAHMMFATVEKSSDGGHVIKPLKQKQFVDGLCYLLQEIYGIENKAMERCKLDPDDEIEDTGSECVICMSDTRDTLILPCRHLCLCNGCAESLRYQSSCCPFCRAPFRALLQIRALRKKQAIAIQQPAESEENPVSQDGVPPGYEAVSLIEALNGQCYPPPPNPLQMPTEGFQRMAEGEAPKPEKKRSVKRRQSEERAAKEALAAAGELKEDKVTSTEGLDEMIDGRGTPEVVMTDQSPDPVKSSRKSPKKSSVPKVRYAEKGSQSAPVSPEGEVTEMTTIKSASVEVVSKVDTPVSSVGIEKPEGQLPVTGAKEGEEDVDKVAEDLAEGDEADDERESTEEDEPAPDYDGDDLAEAEYATAPTDPLEVSFRSASHRKDYYDKAGSKEDLEDSIYQPLQLTETLSLPGTPTD